MSSAAEWDALAGAVGVAYLLAALRLRVDFGNPVHAILFAVVFSAGLLLVVGGLTTPDLRVRILRFRLGRAGKAVEWSVAVALTLLTWLVLDRPLVTGSLALAFGFFWVRRADYYADRREEVARLEGRETRGASETS